MLMVACLCMATSLSGVSCDASRLAMICSGHPFATCSGSLLLLLLEAAAGAAAAAASDMAEWGGRGRSRRVELVER